MTRGVVKSGGRDCVRGMNYYRKLEGSRPLAYRDALDDATCITTVVILLPCYIVVAFYCYIESVM
ncbi:hypothetical protein HAX54_028802, partial [Datura stramonium]|nr:hypothetical protein [Datura stramonium]